MRLAIRTLRNFTWLDGTVKLRNKAVAAEIDRLAIEKLVGHVPGAPVKQRHALAADAAPWVEISLPAVAQLDARQMRVLFELDSKAMFGFEATSANCAYVRAAMAASKTATAARMPVTIHGRGKKQVTRPLTP